MSEPVVVTRGIGPIDAASIWAMSKGTVVEGYVDRFVSEGDLIRVEVYPRAFECVVRSVRPLEEGYWVGLAMEGAEASKGATLASDPLAEMTADRDRLKAVVEEVLSAMPPRWGDSDTWCPECEAYIHIATWAGECARCGTNVEGAYIDGSKCPLLLAHAQLVQGVNS